MSTSAHSLINDFKRLIAEGVLRHGYMFFGESVTARSAVGGALLRLLEDTDGDTMLLDGRILLADAEGTVGIDAVREGIAFLWQKPVRANRKTLFIADGDALTAQAQNALLKTAEDPPEHGLILISVLDPRALVAPLASRFQKIYVAGAKAEELAGAELVAAQLAKKFIAGAVPERKVIIGKVLDAEELPRAEQLLAHFIRHLLLACRKDSVKHARLMGRITDRWAKMQDFNTNKKLQLETLLEA